MKKLMLTLAATSLISTSLMAGVVGKVGEIALAQDGTITLSIIRPDQSVVSPRPLVGTNVQAMLAMLLTAKTSGADIDVALQTINGIRGWSDISLP